MEVALRRHAEETRAQVVSGALRGNALLDVLLALPVADRDAWTEVLLGIEEPPADVAELPRGAVPYLPCGVEEILALLQLPLKPEDMLVDLGAGLGKVLVLAHLLTGVRAHGIELQLPLVERARAICASLGLPQITFAHADVSDVALEGSVFFLYSPFNGDLLTRVVARLQQAAERSPITVCTVGFELMDTRWLVARPSSIASLTVYDSKR